MINKGPPLTLHVPKRNLCLVIIYKNIIHLRRHWFAKSTEDRGSLYTNKTLFCFKLWLQLKGTPVMILKTNPVTVDLFLLQCFRLDIHLSQGQTGLSRSPFNSRCIVSKKHAFLRPAQTCTDTWLLNCLSEKKMLTNK